MIMAGHIALPEYQKRLDPSLADADILPATLAPGLLQGLLKGRLGFNGVVITDASHMLGMASAMRREDYVPRAIAAGCDMFLFFNEIDEDFGFMLKGLRDGVITAERMDDAVRRVLGLKAKLNLHVKAANGSLQKAGGAGGRRVRGAPADACRRGGQGHHPGQEHAGPAATQPGEAPPHAAVLPFRGGRRDRRGRLGHSRRVRRRAREPQVQGHGQRRQTPGSRAGR
jgi:beta-glucosidase-like glycosyl hydrolase